MHFTIYGKPVAQGRPRATVIAGRPHLYDPETSREYKEQVRKMVQLLLDVKYQDAKPYITAELPVVVNLVFYMPIPSRWTKAQKALAKEDKLPHVVKPDCDNLAKSVLDACTGVLWNDDNQIYSLQVKKFYSVHSRVEMDVNYLTDIK